MSAFTLVNGLFSAPSASPSIEEIKTKLAEVKAHLKASEETLKRFRKIEKAEKAEAKKRAEAAKKEAAKNTRATAFAEAVKSFSGTKEALVELSDSIYTRNGGTSNPKEAGWYFNVIVPGLVSLGIASWKGDFLSVSLPEA